MGGSSSKVHSNLKPIPAQSRKPPFSCAYAASEGQSASSSAAAMHLSLPALQLLAVFNTFYCVF
jgi:hypothetical protein